MDPISITGIAALALPVAQATVSCLLALSKFVGPSQHTPKQLKEVLEDLYSFNAAIGNLQVNLEAHKEDQARLNALSGLREPLERSKIALDLIQSWLENKTFASKAKSKVTGVRFDKNLKGCMESLKRSRALFSDMLLIDERAIVSAIQLSLRDLPKNFTNMQTKLQQNHQETKAWHVQGEQQKKDDEDLKVLDWLSPLKFLTKPNDVLSRRHEQTGAWFLHSAEFKEWLAGPVRTLWCHGIPGCGKTVLASIAVDHLRNAFKDENVAVVCVFCSHANPGNQKSTDLIASVLEQLVRSKGVTDGLRTLYQQHHKQHTPLETKEVTKLLKSVIRDTAKVFIVIDALDECPKTLRESFLDELYKLENQLPHLMVTSRYPSSVGHISRDAIQLEIQALDTDLEIYVRSKIQQDRHLAHYVDQDSSLQKDIVEKFVNNAKGMFLLVQLHMESLAKQMAKREMRKALNSLPKELDETYDHAMERIRSQDTEYAGMAKQVLAWLSHAYRPLSVKELQHALAVHPGDRNFDEDGVCSEEDLVSLCAGLVTVDRKSEIIRLVHHTAQEYFDRARSQTFPTMQIEIASVCITYLEFDDLVSDKYTLGNEYIKVSNEMRSKYPFLVYAGKYWGHHARGPPVDIIGGMILRFLRHKLRGGLACNLIDDSPGYWDFGPMPALSILVRFGLEHVVSNLDRFDDENQGPTCAIRYRNSTTVFLLVDHGAFWHDSGEHIIAAECTSQKLEGKENMVRLLAKKGVTVDLGVDNGAFLFFWALFKRAGAEERLALPHLLRELGATFDPQSLETYTPLMHAILGGDDLDVRYLLRTGVPVNEKNKHGRDALIYAALARHAAVVGPLLEAGANVNSRDEDGMTPLCAACEGGNEEIVKRLLQSGADISAQTNSGRTATSIATVGENQSLLRLLRDHGTGDHSEAEAEVDNETKRDTAELDAEINAVWDYLDDQEDVRTSDSKFLVAIRRQSTKSGIEKTVHALLDAYVKEKERENSPTFVEDPELEASEPDLIVRRAKRAMKQAEKELDRSLSRSSL